MDGERQPPEKIHVLTDVVLDDGSDDERDGGDDHEVAAHSPDRTTARQGARSPFDWLHLWPSLVDEETTQRGKMGLGVLPHGDDEALPFLQHHAWLDGAMVYTAALPMAGRSNIDELGPAADAGVCDALDGVRRATQALLPAPAHGTALRPTLMTVCAVAAGCEGWGQAWAGPGCRRRACPAAGDGVRGWTGDADAALTDAVCRAVDSALAIQGPCVLLPRARHPPAPSLAAITDASRSTIYRGFAAAADDLALAVKEGRPVVLAFRAEVEMAVGAATILAAWAVRQRSATRDAALRAALYAVGVKEHVVRPAGDGLLQGAIAGAAAAALCEYNPVLVATSLAAHDASKGWRSAQVLRLLPLVRAKFPGSDFVVHVDEAVGGTPAFLHALHAAAHGRLRVVVHKHTDALPAAGSLEASLFAAAAQTVLHPDVAGRAAVALQPGASTDHGHLLHAVDVVLWRLGALEMHDGGGDSGASGGSKKQLAEVGLCVRGPWDGEPGPGWIHAPAVLACVGADARRQIASLPVHDDPAPLAPDERALIGFPGWLRQLARTRLRGGGRQRVPDIPPDLHDRVLCIVVADDALGASADEIGQPARPLLRMAPASPGGLVGTRRRFSCLALPQHTTHAQPREPTREQSAPTRKRGRRSAARKAAAESPADVSANGGPLEHGPHCMLCGEWRMGQREAHAGKPPRCARPRTAADSHRARWGVRVCVSLFVCIQAPRSCRACPSSAAAVVGMSSTSPVAPWHRAAATCTRAPAPSTWRTLTPTPSPPPWPTRRPPGPGMADPRKPRRKRRRCPRARPLGQQHAPSARVLWRSTPRVSPSSPSWARSAAHGAPASYALRLVPHRRCPRTMARRRAMGACRRVRGSGGRPAHSAADHKSSACVGASRAPFGPPCGAGDARPRSR